VRPLCVILTSLVAAAGVQPEQPATDLHTVAPADPLVPFPHPLITEILYAVPTEDGDANRDDQRHVSGDEFIELTNPHDEPIELEGYTLRDSARDESRRFDFTFPKLTLEPGQTAVVFNGCETRWHGPVGDDHRAPIAPHPWFTGSAGDAFIFTARCSGAVTLANSGDFILLIAPAGDAVHCITWGTPRTRPPPAVALLEEAGRVTQTSLQRESIGGRPIGELARHDDLDGRAFSPGEALVLRPMEPEPRADPP
jgi:hypothetical protein